MARFARFLLAAVAVLTCIPVLNADAQQPTQYTAINLAEVDADFYLQGEYYGQLWDDFLYSDWKTVGLQVVALGGGRFDAVLYAGGLPGSGWDERQVFKLSGTQHNCTLDLTGDSFRVVVESGYALVHAANGQPLGQIVKVSRESPTLGAMVPWDGRVIFDGSSTAMFERARVSADNLLMPGAITKDVFRDFTMHAEFQVPYMPAAREQARGNSGIYIQQRYEVQILDSFGLEGADNESGALYRQRRPDLNMALPPLSWQTYDIKFRSPRFDDAGNKIQNATITVWLNGVAVQNGVEILAKTGAGRPEGPNLLPIVFQDHRNPVRFRNIWVVDHEKTYPRQNIPHPYPPVADPGIQYGTYIAPMMHYRIWEYPLAPRRAPSWFYYPDERW